MKSRDMVWVEHDAGTPPLPSPTNFEPVNALTEEQIHAAALADPDAQPIPPGSDEALAARGLVRVVNVKRLREKLGLTQEAFAAAYRIPIGTLRDWEQRRKFPDAPARAYLTVIASSPQVVAELLEAAA